MGIHKSAKRAIHSTKRAERNNGRSTIIFLGIPSFDRSPRFNLTVAQTNWLPTFRCHPGLERQPYLEVERDPADVAAHGSIGKVMCHGQHPEKINMLFCAQACKLHHSHIKKVMRSCFTLQVVRFVLFSVINFFALPMSLDKGARSCWYLHGAICALEEMGGCFDGMFGIQRA